MGDLWRYRELLFLFVRRDLKVRYKNSVLGFGWSLLNPLAHVAILTLVLLFLLAPANRPENYHAYVFCATLPWLFFSTAVLDSTTSLIGWYNLMRKTSFPRELLPLASVAANLIHFLLATAAFILYMGGVACFWWIVSGHFNWPLQASILLTPLPMLGLTLLVVGASFFVSVWTLYFEDIRFLLDSGFKILHWLVPVVYFADQILAQDPWGRGRLIYTLYMLNPLAPFITSFRKLTLRPTKMIGTSAVTPPMTPEDWLFLGIAIASSALVAVAGYRYFTARKWKLAERG